MTSYEHHRYSEGEALAVTTARTNGLAAMVRAVIDDANYWAPTLALDATRIGGPQSVYRHFLAGWLDEAIWLASLDAARAVGGVTEWHTYATPTDAQLPRLQDIEAARKLQGK